MQRRQLPSDFLTKTTGEAKGLELSYDPRVQHPPNLPFYLIFLMVRVMVASGVDGLWFGFDQSKESCDHKTFVEEAPWVSQILQQI